MKLKPNIESGFEKPCLEKNGIKVSYGYKRVKIFIKDQAFNNHLDIEIKEFPLVLELLLELHDLITKEKQDESV